VGQFPNKYVIGLTGNIATGKSVVRQMLQHLGAYTIDADSLAHQVMMPNAPAYKPIINTFGEFIVGADGRIDRAILGRVVFNNPEALKKLEDITHPVIRQGIMALVNRAQQRVIVIEAIKLLEGDLAKMVDSIWVVDSSPLTQYKRLIEKRKMSEADAKSRIQSQPPQAEKVKRANVVIKNDADVEATWKQVQAAWNDIRRQLSAPTAPSAPVAPATPSAPTAAKPAPAPAPVPLAPIDAPEKSIDMGGVTVKRGMPGSAQAIAEFITKTSGKSIDRMDVMMSFGQKSLMVGFSKDSNIVSVIGWTVENLVTRMDEFHVSNGANIANVVNAMTVAVEDASKDLQSEVAFFFLPTTTSAAVVDALKAQGYESVAISEIKIPVWRDAVQETLSQSGNQIVLLKRLRADRVLQPI
jgi:dephospho-CoA kinase